jgi:glucosamine--fructose-6-phosphate aminotransferase (isomerizing)
MTQPGAYSEAEITTQGESWQSAIEATLAQRQALLALLERTVGEYILFIGCGSTHYLALWAAPYFQQVTGRFCRAAPSSELYLQTETLVAPGERPLVVALSRSGETSETILAVEKMRARGCEALTVSCYDDTALSRASALTIGIPGGREESYAQTRSFAGMLVAVQTLAALAANDAALLEETQRLPALADDLIARARPLAQAWGPDERIKRITYLGSGALYGLANEATVKVKEMSLSVAEGYHFMEFRHGPMSLLDDEHLVVALLSDALREYELGVLRDLKERGARLLILANCAEGLEGACDGLFALQSSLSERARSVLYLPFVQLFAYHRAMGRGLNPDRPRNVVMAIRLTGAEMVS